MTSTATKAYRMFGMQPARLDKEQDRLLLALVDAYQSHSEPFLVIEAANAMGHVVVNHQAFNESVTHHHLQMLLRERFLHITERGAGGGVWLFAPTREARAYYNEIKRQATWTGPTKSLDDYIRNRDLPAISEEFDRALRNVDADPPAAVTAACAIVEATCKVIIADENLPMPSDKSIQPLWRTIQGRLNLDPSRATSTDLRQILSGLTSIVQGVGALRTHAGSAHGGTAPIDARHARLAVHAAHTLTLFILESWKRRA